VGDSYTALGRFDLAFRLNGLGALVGGVAIYVALRSGINGAAAVVAVIGLALYGTALGITAPSKRTLREIAQQSMPYGGVALAGAGMAFGLRHLFQTWGLGPAGGLAAVAVAILLVVYGLAFHRQIRGMLAAVRTVQTNASAQRA
jgi:hypothetical protein